MSIGRMLIGLGLVIAAVGILFVLFERMHLPLGRLPGDVVWKGKNTTVYVPVVTCLLLSLLGTLVLWLFSRR